MRRRRAEAPPAAQALPKRPEALLDSESALELAGLFDQCFAGDLQAAVPRLISLMGATTAPSHFPDASIWVKLASSAIGARAAGTQMALLKAAQFTEFWHSQVHDQAPEVLRFFLGAARREHVDVIYSAAFEACEDLDQAELVVPTTGETVANTAQFLSMVLGRAYDFRRFGELAAAEHKQALIRDVLDEAEHDQGQRLFVDGVRTCTLGNQAAGLEMLEASARLGLPDAMLEAGRVAGVLGDAPRSRFWAETAASAGHAEGMYNCGALALAEGDLATAERWIEQAATSGNHGGYTALNQLAENRGDGDAARRWAAVGAQLEKPRCLQMHGMYLFDGQLENASTALPYLQRAATLGNVNAMVQSAVVLHAVGVDAQASYWLDKAEAAGNPDAQRLRTEYAL